MGNITVKFIGKDYSLPEDLSIYIDLLAMSEEVKCLLYKDFLKKLSMEQVSCVGDEQLQTEIVCQVGRYITMLTDKGIYDRTVNDYLKENEGYKLISKVNKDALDEAKRVLKNEMDEFKRGYEEALHKRNTSVTGMGLSIWSGSFVNHAIYAAMEASTLHKQEQAAIAEYQKDMDELDARIEERKNEEQKEYIKNIYKPHMEIAITVFVYGLLDTYISDLIRENKIDKNILSYVDIGRSNDLLNNLSFSKNKEEILRKAFESCPYNLQVYLNAIDCELMNYATFETAEFFGKGRNILYWLQSNLGDVKYPNKFQINYSLAETLAEFTKRDVRYYLQSKTKEYVEEIVIAYQSVANNALSKKYCQQIIREFDDNSILSRDNISKAKAHTCVNAIVSNDIWHQLIEKCGYTDLLDRIRVIVPEGVVANSKLEVDTYLIEKLMKNYELAREELAEQIKKKRLEEEKQRQIEAKNAEKVKRWLKKGAIIGIIAIVVLAIWSMVISHFSLISNIEKYISQELYEKAFDMVNDSDLSEKKKDGYRDIIIPNMQTQIVDELERYQVLNIDGARVCLEDNVLSYYDEDEHRILCYEGDGKIIDDIMYANGYIFFAEGYDGWGYDVKSILIKNQTVTDIITFDEFNTFVKLEDGRIFIDSAEKDDILYNPYLCTMEEVFNFSSEKQVIDIVYDSDNYGQKKREYK